MQACRVACNVFLIKCPGGRHLGEEGQDGDASMAANDGHGDPLRGYANRVGHERIGAQHVQLCHAQQFARIVRARPAEHKEDVCR